MTKSALRAAVLTLLALFSVSSFAADRTVVLSPNADYPGFDYAIRKDVDLAACQGICVADKTCKAFTYNTKARWCFLKSDVGTLTETAGATGGKIVEPEQPPAAAAEPAPALDFLDQALIDQGQRFAEQLRQAPPPEVKDLALLRADVDRRMFMRDFPGAAVAAKGAIALGANDYGIWRGLALATLATVTNDTSYRALLNGDAVSAALTAFQRGTRKAEYAEALALLADAIARTENYRAALETYRASLKLDQSPMVSAAYEKLLAERGFRVVEQTVDSDTAEPRMCVTLSDSVAPGAADVTPFVLLNGAAPKGVTVSGSQICVNGLKHGERYTLTLREGLAAGSGETLLKEVSVTNFVRDRQAALRFSGTSFVLPREGRQAIPIVSVNAQEAKLWLYRVDDRALSSVMRTNQFLNQLNSYDLNQLAADHGQEVWKGFVTTGTSLNQEVTTAIPVDTMMGERQPGVYILSAEPVGSRFDEWTPRATQWFVVTDLGLTTVSNANGMHVFVRSLNTAKAVTGVPVALIARNNDLLGTTVTDASGHALFAPGLLRGTSGAAPLLVTAGEAGGDTAFLDLSRPAFDFSDRGVGGRQAPGPIDLFVYTDRGVYRPGHTVHLTTLARDDQADAMPGLPLTVIVSRPDGVEFQRFAMEDQGLGGRGLSIALPASAMRGTWSAAIHTDVKQSALALHQFLVDDYVPDRVEFDLKPEGDTVSLEEANAAEVDARFLYGAPAAGLTLEGEFVLTPKRELAAHLGFVFGLTDKGVTATRTALTDLGATDENGKARFEYQAGDIPQTTQPLAGTLVVRVAERGGRAVERRVEVAVESSAALIGIKPLFTDVGEGQTAEFEIISLDAEGGRSATRLSWELVKVNRDFQWYQSGGAWNYQANEYTERVAGGEIDTSADAPVKVGGPVKWDSYQLVVTSLEDGGPQSSFDFYAGWYTATSGADTPDVLRVGLDKPDYKRGETAKLRIVPRFPGVALVHVIGAGIVETKEVPVGVEPMEVPLAVTDRWDESTYVVATLYRPSGVGDDKLPGRAVGVAHAGVSAAERTHVVTINAPSQIKPNTTLAIDVAAANLAPGEEAYFTVAAVDVGILNLTRYTPPKPQEWYFGKRRLGLEFRDAYSMLINGALGALGQVRSGAGDEEEARGLLTIEGSPPEPKPIAFYSGVLKADNAGKATVSFDIPEFNGSLRVMAVAWSKKGVGSGVADVVVRDPVVVTDSLPRFLAPGDTSRLRLDFANTDGPAGDYTLGVSASPGLDVSGAPKSVTLGAGKSVSLLLPLKALTAGTKSIIVSLDHPSGLHIERNLWLLVRDGQMPRSTKRIVTLPSGQTLNLTPDLLSGLANGDGTLTVSITRSGALDVPGLLQSLDRYPYGCTEQQTSRALPLLYLDEVAARAGLEGDAAVRERVQQAIYGVLANQSSIGSFGLWGPDSGDLWLDSYVADFLTRAREQKYDVPAAPFEQALQNLQNELAYISAIEDRDSEVAYAVYVLARNRRASLGDLRFYAETKLNAFETPIAKAQIGAALGFYGDRERAEQALAAAYLQLKATTAENFQRYDYGSNLRDGAAILALAGESAPGADFIPELARRIALAQARDIWTSTQEESWLLLAAHALMSGGKAPALTVAGKPSSGDYVQTFTAADLAAGTVSIVNTAGYQLEAVLTITGVPAVSEPAGGNGFSIDRKYFTLAGAPADLATLKQNDRMVVTLQVSQLNSWPTRLLVTDLLPSGLEIDSPALVGSADLANFSWLGASPPNAHLEFRDDRFVAALSRPIGDNGPLTFAYVVRAVSPGNFVLPAAQVEDMYRPNLNARTATGALEVVGPLK